MPKMEESVLLGILAAEKAEQERRAAELKAEADRLAAALLPRGDRKCGRADAAVGPGAEVRAAHPAAVRP